MGPLQGRQAFAVRARYPRLELLLGLLITAALVLVAAPRLSATPVSPLPVCTIVGTPANDVLTGSDGRDVICGGSGNDTLLGQGGDDVLVGGNGADELNGGSGTDTANWQARPENLTVTIDGVANDGGSKDDSASVRDNVMTDVENVQGGHGSDSITGSAADNVLDGGADGPDQLFGLGGKDTLNGSLYGADTLSGGDQDDTLDGRLGADDLIGGDGTDTADYSSRNYGVTVTLDGVANDGSTGDDNGTRRDDVQADVENVKGGQGDDSLTGNAGDNVLDGGVGIDSLLGLDGNDTLLARNFDADAQLNCDGGSSPGSADSADVDSVDPPTSGCETVTSH